jgi:hypothetical protein
MKFDYTFISIMGYPVFEPMILLTNSFLFGISLYSFRVLRRFAHDYARCMAWFTLLLGVSSVFGAIGHAVHLQLGDQFFAVVLFLMNAFSLLAIYYFFLAPFAYLNKDNEQSRKWRQGARIWLGLIILISLFSGNFLLIKINAAFVLIYSLVMHYRAHRTRDERGNLLIVTGVLISFIPIFIHSYEISLHKWFNYKDLSHVFMIISLIFIFVGARRNSGDLGQEQII